MTRLARPYVLLMLLLGFFLSGCATSDKSNTANKIAASDQIASANVNAPTATNASTPTSSLPADANASGGDSSTPDVKKASESFGGPVFRNAAPAAYPAPYRDKRDPWEPMNRAVFGFNETVDDYFLRPVAEGYRWLVPVPIRMAVGNVFSNLNDIPVTVNNLLQLKFNNALTSSMRLVVNSTFGLAGLVDIASDIGLEKHDEDFGQTMGHHGVASGPYFVIPFLGPSSARDAGGRVLDIASDPVFLGSFFVAPFIGPVVGGTRVTDTRAGLLKSEKTLEEASLDKYEFIRDAYLQRRRNLVYDGKPPRNEEDEDNE